MQSSTSSPGFVRHHADQRVAFVQADADDAARLDPAVLGQGRLLDQAAPRGHQQEMLIVEGPHRDHAGDLLFLLERQHVGHGPARRGPAPFGDLVDPQPVQLAPVGEAQQIRVGAGHEEMLDEVIFAGLAAGDAPAAAVLDCGKC